MPINSKLVQTRLPPDGVIRLGYSEPGNRGGKKPKKLDKFRLTSPSEPFIVEAAALYGGEPQPWQSDEGPQWQVFTTADAIKVFVPRQRIDPFMEYWEGRAPQRKCDGEREYLRGQPCKCLQGCRLYPEHDFETNLLSRGECPCGAKRLCKPTTRLSVMLADVHSAGTWKLETHGWNAAAELPGLADAIAVVAEPVPATLRLRMHKVTRVKIQRGVEGTEVRQFAVPYLDFGGLFTPRQAYEGQLTTAARAAIGAPSLAAIAAGPTRPTLTEEQILDQAKHLQTPDQVARLREMAEAGGALTPRVEAALAAVTADLDEAREQREAVDPDRARRATAKAAVASQPPKDVIVDAEVVPDEAIRELWQEAVRLAAALGWGEDVVIQRFERRYGYHPGDESRLRLADFEAFRDLVRDAKPIPPATAEQAT
ncbi:hypothetical protein I0C86_41665 [Plantactinospora sp. S1510]|uniref:Uncharacterized protein n=1 Tax=Plantactinospora alkalitolerans TaxID=2789879 RepID=A0ABS0HA59_9ACTN|nr:hypothetical protein [Plantactinospora alkalitolerans]MBF9135362.1 hypothetical protein [Plantactinospora alkalitolerans]